MKERFSDLGRVGAIEKLYEGTPWRPFAGTTFTPKDGAKVVSVSRTFIEGIDFNLVYFPLKHLGGKSVTAVSGALCAAFARPYTLSVRLGISAKLDFEQVQELWSGIASVAREDGYAAVDLDLAPSPNGLTVSVSATGETVLQTAAPQSKDVLCISGRLGSAFLGLQVLERESQRFDASGSQPSLEKYRMMIGAYLHPELDASVPEKLAAAGITPTGGWWVSRGLADAVRTVVRDTGLGAKVYADRIPFEGNSFELGRELGLDTISAAMNGGDDFRLLLSVPILQAETFRRDFQTFDVIGHLAQSNVGAVLVAPDGMEYPMKAQGWNND